MYRKKALFSSGARRSDTCNRVLEAGGWLGEGIFSCCIRQVRLYTTLLRKIIVKLYFYLCRTYLHSRVPFTLHTCAFRPAENRVFSSMLEFKFHVHLLRNFMYTYVYNKKIRRSLYCPTRLSAVLSSSRQAKKKTPSPRSPLRIRLARYGCSYYHMKIASS